MTKSNDEETNPSMKGLSSDALNLFLKFSPKESNRCSSLRAEPINPPISIEPSIKRSEELFGSAALNCVDQSGISADAAPSRVTRPKISVMSFWLCPLRRFPRVIPIPEPMAIATTLRAVPEPMNPDPIPMLNYRLHR
jgi:hypothetical protein